MVNTGMRKFPWRYDVQAGTGYSSSTNPRGQWARGALYRAPGFAFQLPAYNAMRDRSADANTLRQPKRRRFSKR